MFTLLELVLMVVLAGFIISSLYKKFYSSRIDVIKHRYQEELRQQRKQFEQELREKEQSQSNESQIYTTYQSEREVDFFKHPKKED